MFQETQGNERREYPVVRAQKLNHEIKKLGSNESGHSYMDQFRMLIAEIGNALGFVRMVRLGGLSYSSLATGYVCQTNLSYIKPGTSGMCVTYNLCHQTVLTSSSFNLEAMEVRATYACFSGFLEVLFLVNGTSISHV